MTEPMPRMIPVLGYPMANGEMEEITMPLNSRFVSVDKNIMQYLDKYIWKI